MKKYALGFLVVVLVLTLPFLNAYAKKRQVIRVPGGTTIQGFGLTFDASHDKKLDVLVPGYKCINVAVMNQSLNIITLDPEGDEYYIRTAGEKRPIKAISDMRSHEPKLWEDLPDRVKTLIGYPLYLPIAAREVLDIFVPDTVDVTNFNEIDIYIKSLDTRLEILVRQ